MMDEQLTERNKIHQVAKDYEKKGYQVIIEPRGSDVPSFIKNYQPDLIASNDKETVIIEVKTRTEFSTIKKIRHLADIINNKKGWRFELIVTSSKVTSETLEEKKIKEYSKKEMEKNLDIVKQLIKQKLFVAAFVLSWALFESLARQLLLQEKKYLNNRTPLVIIKTLFSFGYVSKRDYDALETLFRIRNEVVHGYKTKKLDKKSVLKVSDIVQRMLSENRNRVKSLMLTKK